MSLERRIEFMPAKDCHDKCEYGSARCKPDSGGYHGISCVNLRMAVVGLHGAVNFSVFTGWYKPETRERQRQQRETDFLPVRVRGVVRTDGETALVTVKAVERLQREVRLADMYPMPADLGVHKLREGTTTEEREWRTRLEHCDLLDKECFYDGSGLQAKPVFNALTVGGSEAVFEILEARYREEFGGAE